MSHTSNRGRAFFAFLALASLASATADDGLKYTGKVDVVRKFKFSGVFKLNGQDVKVTTDVTTKVIKVDEAGQVSLQVASTNHQMVIEGQNVPVPDSPALIKVFRQDGSLAELHGEGASPEAYRLETLESVKLPPTAITKDKTWTWDVPADPKSGVVKSTIVFKVLGDEKIAGVDAWKISRSVKELSGDSPAIDDGTVWISKTDGIVVKQDDKWTNAPVKLGPNNFAASFVLELQP